MAGTTYTQRLQWSRWFAEGAALLAAAIGVAVLAGWALDIAPLKSILPNHVTMKANTALAFVLSGAALWLLGGFRPGLPHAVPAGRTCAALAGLLGVATLCEYGVGLDLGIDQILFREAANAVDTSAPGRMAPNTAVCFVLLALALSLVETETRRGFRFTEFLAVAISAIAMLALMGYVYDVGALSGFTPRYTLMAVHTAGVFLLLAAGLACARPDRGWMALGMSEGMAGVLLRQLIPALALTMIFLGWLRLVGQRHALYSPEFGTAFFTWIRVLIVGAIVYAVARKVRAIEAVRQNAEEDLRQLNASLEQHIAERTHEIRTANENLKLEHDFVSLILDTVGALVVVLDPRGRIVRFNRACEKVTGYFSEEVTGKPLWDVLLLPEDLEGVKAVFQQLRAGDFPQRHENSWRTKDGNRRLIAWTNTCLLGADGKVTHVIGTGLDMTDRQRAEEEVRALNADLERRVQERTAQLNASNRELETFAYSVSHDLRGPLQAISGFGEVLLQDYGPQLDAHGLEYLKQLHVASERMAELIEALLALSRLTQTPMKRERTDLSALARAAVAELQQLQPERAVAVTIADGVTANADPQLLRIVLDNLLGNAWKFTAKQPQPHIEFGVIPAAGDAGPVYFVRDNGAGFRMKHAHRLFAAFQRLHSAADFPGTGIGLATVQRIITRHGGRVWADGEEGKGAMFCFTL